MQTVKADYFIFGHRHLPIDYTIKGTQVRYINLGEWMNFNSFASFDGENLELSFFENDNGKIYGNKPLQQPSVK
jgi:UDP-2,3-diacylglucosamine hydrolase